MDKIIGCLCLVLSFAGLVSCRSQENFVSLALDIAGDNRSELKAVLDHYSAPQDSLKRRAAEYLIGNMAGKYTVTSPALEAYEELLPEIARVPADDRFLYLFYKGERNFER